jgi:hypothetical protein
MERYIEEIFARGQMIQQVNERVALQARKYVYGLSDAQSSFVAARLGKKYTATPLDELALPIPGCTPCAKKAINAAKNLIWGIRVGCIMASRRLRVGSHIRVRRLGYYHHGPDSQDRRNRRGWCCHGCGVLGPAGGDSDRRRRLLV